MSSLFPTERAGAFPGALSGKREAGMSVKPSLQWALEALQRLSMQGHTGTVTVRLVNGGVQGITVNQELQPQHSEGMTTAPTRTR